METVSWGSSHCVGLGSSGVPSFWSRIDRDPGHAAVLSVRADLASPRSARLVADGPRDSTPSHTPNPDPKPPEPWARRSITQQGSGTNLLNYNGTEASHATGQNGPSRSRQTRHPPSPVMSAR